MSKNKSSFWSGPFLLVCCYTRRQVTLTVVEQSELATLHEKDPTLPRKVLVSSDCLGGTASSICRTEIVPKFFPETHVSAKKCAVHTSTNPRHWERRPCGVVNSRLFLCLLQRSAAERVLRQLQEHPDTWTRVVDILQKSQVIDSKFFALQV